MNQLQAIARYIVPADNHNQVLQLLRQLAEHTRAEPGNIAFDIYENVEDPTRVVLLERYESPASFAAHRQTPHFQQILLGQIVPLLTDRTVEELDVRDA